MGGVAVIVIGLDPGTHTGLAEWSAYNQNFDAVGSMPIHEAMERVLHLRLRGDLHHVVFEDARLRTWFGSKGRESLQGAGSVKRDCAIWADFLGAKGIAHKRIKPAAGATKWTQESFAKATGWAGRTNEHGRDAALLVWGTRIV